MTFEGTTTKQMREAPHEAIYIWCNSNLSYPIMMSHRLARKDLIIVSPSWLSPDKPYGLKRQVVIDHATELTTKQWEVFQEITRRKSHEDTEATRRQGQDSAG